MLKHMRRHWHWRRKRFYFNNRWHLVLDLTLGVVVILLVALFITVQYYKPNLGDIFSFKFDRGAEIDMNNPPLEFNFSVSDIALEMGEKVSLSIAFKNVGEREISNIKVDLVPTTDNFSINRVESAGNIDISGHQLTLPSLGGHESQEVSVNVFFSARSNEYRIIKWKADTEYVVRGQVIKHSFDLNDVKIISELFPKSSAYYNSPQGDQLGAGPLPPIAFLPTNYWVFWDVTSNGNFSDFVMSAQLPVGVELTGSEALLSGNLNYNASSRKLIWTVSLLESQKDDYRVGFEIQLIPEEEQIGKILPLVTGITYYASDELSKKEVSGGLNGLTTNLDFDRINKGQGKVMDQ